MATPVLPDKIGQYRVIERLGAGGMGHVYRAKDEMLGREVALKIIDTPMENATARLRAEAAALARLSHPGIATVYELIEDDGRLVMVMELVRGSTLQQLLEENGVCPPRYAAELCVQALNVIQHAHAAGIFHRDLKPGNLMVTESGGIKIMDFGIARHELSVGLTNAGAMIGTPAYMAPEQVLGHPIDARTDLYAIGVVLFRLTTGGFPFKGQTPFEMTQSQVNDAPAKPSELRSDLPAWVDDIVLRALSKQPAGRFQSAAEFTAALTTALASETAVPVATNAAVEITEVMPRPETVAGPAVATAQKPAATPPKKAKRNGWWQMVAALAVLGLGTWLLPSDRTTPNAAQADAQPLVADSAVPPAAEKPNVAAIPTATTQPASLVARPTPKTTPSSSPAASPVPTASASAAPARAAASFNDVKMLALNGSKATTSDVVLQLSDNEVNVRTKADLMPLALMPYQGITKATYTQGREPKWDEKLAAPKEKINAPGIGILSPSRHWLVLQGADRFVILRLDGADRADVMRVFEERAGIPIDRTSKGK